MIVERSGAIPARIARVKDTSIRPQTRIPSLSLPGRQWVAVKLGGSLLVQLMLAMTFIALAAMLYLAQASQASVARFNIDDLVANRNQIYARNASLQAVATSLQSPERVDSLATSRLHMAKPDFSKIIWIRPVVPRLSISSGSSASTSVARYESEPLALTVRFLAFAKSSL